MKAKITSLFLLCLALLSCSQKDKTTTFEELTKYQEAYNNFPILDIKPKHKALVLGTFHFNNASDVSHVKGKIQADIMSEKNQKLIDSLLKVLKGFNPTKITIEQRPEAQDKVDSLYNEYRAGRYELKTNEIFQIGFKLAKLMNHDRVYCVDHNVPLPETVIKAGKWEPYADSLGHTEIWQAYDKVNDRFNTYMDSLKTELNVFELVRLYNTELFMHRGRQTWVTGLINLGHGDLYVGADLLGRWHKNNARIFAYTINLLPKKENENILMIYGAAHKRELDEMFDSNPEYEVVQLEDLLKQ